MLLMPYLRSLPIAVTLSLAVCATANASDSPGSWFDLGAGLPGVNGSPALTGTGALAAQTPMTLSLQQAAPNAPAFLIIGLQSGSTPLLGGTLVPSPDVVLDLSPTSASGSIDLLAAWPSGIPVGIDYYFQYWIGDNAGPFGASASNAVRATSEVGPTPGVFPAAWIKGGSDCPNEPKIQVHAYNEDFYILRQSLCTNYEAPFLYLLFGDDEVLLMDSGAGNIPLANTVYGIINDWLVAHGKTSIHLTVSHLHGHGDHVAGDSQFAGQPNTTVVGTSQNSVKNFFGITSWPTQIVTRDLGNRILDIIPIPGHHSAHIAIYDRETGVLFTGDSLYPGRLYVFGAISQGNWPIYQASMQRLVDFTADKPLCWVLGTHIEMSQTPGVDFPIGSTSHYNERELQLTRDHLLELNQAIKAMGNQPVKEVHNDFIIYPTG